MQTAHADERVRNVITSGWSDHALVGGPAQGLAKTAEPPKLWGEAGNDRPEMIHYQLQCAAGHAFDGWFKDIAAFEAQARRGLVECPVCGGTKVSRGLMTPAIGAAARRKGRPEPVPAAATPGQALAGGKLPAELLARLQRMRAEIEARCDYVGREFADEARKIHAGESPRTGIYGEATKEEAEALQEEGIAIASIPWVPRADG